MSEPGTTTDIFARILRGVLRPLVRLLIAHGITAPAFYRLLKRIYVEVAEESAGDGKPLTDSRISVLTGVHRRDVKEYRNTDLADEAVIQQKVTLLASVLGRWLASSDTTDAQGNPRPLPRTASDGPSFDGLVSEISKDIRARTVLDELSQQGLVETGQDGLIHVRSDAFVGPEDLDQRVFFFGENVGDHIAAAADNLLDDKPRHLERAVFYNRLSPASIDLIEKVARESGTELLSSMNRLAHDLQSTDVETGDGDGRFRFGIFFYRDQDKNETGGRPGATGDDDDKT